MNVLHIHQIKQHRNFKLRMVLIMDKLQFNFYYNTALIMQMQKIRLELLFLN